MKTLIYYLHVGDYSKILDRSIWSLLNIAKYTGDYCVLANKTSSPNTIDINDYIVNKYGKPNIDRYQIFHLKYVIDEFVDISNYDNVIYVDSDVIFKDKMSFVFDYIRKSDKTFLPQENVFGNFRSHVGATDYFKVVENKYSDVVSMFDNNKHICAGFFCVKKKSYSLFKDMRDIIIDSDNKIDDQSALNIIHKTKYNNETDIFPRHLVYFNNANDAPVQHCCDKSAIDRFFDCTQKYSKFNNIKKETILENTFYVQCIEQPHLGGNVLSSPDMGGMCPNLWCYFKNDLGINSILDVGCGEGHAAECMKDIGFEVFGVDGLKYNIDKTNAKGIEGTVCDLTKSEYIHSKEFDMVWCCEVVEHIEEKYIHNLMKTLCQFKYLAMTFAEPGQLGYHHVNCKDKKYWLDWLYSYGFIEQPINDEYIDKNTWFHKHGIFAKKI